LRHLGQLAEQPDLTATRYELVEEIGRGGMATVYLARDRDLDRLVALKVMRGSMLDGDARQRMAAECRIMARLEHPGIVPVHESGVLPDGRVYYTMKFVRGRRLDDQVLAAIALPERLRLFEKICQAVAFAHAQGVIHRDLKPGNVMVGPFGEVLVIDWGIARHRAAAAVAPTPVESQAASGSQTGHGTVLGTPGYMAPEQARGELDQVDERSDVYGLGGILRFLLTGHSPAATGGQAADPPGPKGGRPGSQRRSSRARPLEAICRKALAAEPAERYARASELADEMARFLAGERVTAYRETALDTVGRLAAKYRAAVVLVVAYLLMRIFLLFWLRT
jgi:serine/threonine protein kinase